MDTVTAKREALWRFVEARLEEIVQALDLPILDHPKLFEALVAGYLAALEDLAPRLYQALTDGEAPIFWKK